MKILFSLTIIVLAVAAFLNAAALGEQYALKRATKRSVAYRVGIFVVDLSLMFLVFRSYMA